MAPACVPRRHIHLFSVCFIVFLTFIDLMIHNDLMIQRVSVHPNMISWLFLVFFLQTVIIIIRFMNPTLCPDFSLTGRRSSMRSVLRCVTERPGSHLSSRIIIPINPLSADGSSAGPALPKRSSLSRSDVQHHVKPPPLLFF